MTTASLVLASVALVLSVLALLGFGVSVAVVMNVVRGAEGRLLAHAQSAFPQATATLKDLKAAEARARSMLRRAGPAESEQDIIERALETPIGRGIAKGAGIDVDKLKAGDEGELRKVEAVLKGGTEGAEGTAIYL